jgi:4-amino-4-deoxy-L-arabinose transferase-like glycosyltransferase
MNATERNHRVWLLFLGLLCFIPLLGGVHLFDWDEINFAECAREMIASKNYLDVQMAFQPFYEKPPFFIWLQVVSMKTFGVGEFAARFPNAICGVLTLQVVYTVGKKWFNEQIGWLWAFAFLISLLPHFYFKTGIIDPWFNLFIFLTLVHLHAYLSNGKNNAAALAGLWLGLAILTKGPVAALLVGVTGILFLVICIWKAKRNKWPSIRLNGSALFWFFFIALLPSLLWYGAAIYRNGVEYMNEFIAYQIRLLQTEDAGHGGFPGYHVVVLLFGCFPASFFALKRLFFRNNPDRMQYLMGILFWVVLVLFSLVQSKIVHYSSLAYFPITYFAALGWYDIVHRQQPIPRSLVYTITAFMVVLGFIVCCLPWLGNHKEVWQFLLEKDAFAKANLQAQVQWNYKQAIPGVFLLLGGAIFLCQYRRKAKFALLGLGIGVLLFIQSAILLITPNIEAISQRAAIDFFQNKAGENAYLVSYGYKSYAPYFYGRLQPGSTPPSTWLDKEISKPVYLVAKITSASDPFLQQQIRLYEKNGFVFYRMNK